MYDRPSPRFTPGLAENAPARRGPGVVGCPSSRSSTDRDSKRGESRVARPPPKTQGDCKHRPPRALLCFCRRAPSNFNTGGRQARDAPLANHAPGLRLVEIPNPSNVSLDPRRPDPLSQNKIAPPEERGGRARRRRHREHHKYNPARRGERAIGLGVRPFVDALAPIFRARRAKPDGRWGGDVAARRPSVKIERSRFMQLHRDPSPHYGLVEGCATWQEQQP